MTAKAELAGRLRAEAKYEASRFRERRAQLLREAAAALTEAGAGEVVAWRWTLKDIPDDWRVGIGHPQLPEARFLIEPLYASPPPVQPVPEGVKGTAPPLPALVTDEMVERALKARVPGGSEVWYWLPKLDDWTPHQTARDVMRCALKAAIQPAEQPDDLRAEIERLAKERDALVLSTGEHITRRSELLVRAEAADAEADRLRQRVKDLEAKLTQIAERADKGGRRIETAMSTCEWIEAFALEPLLDKPGGK